MRSHGWSQLLPFSLHQEPIELVRIHKLNSGELVRLMFRAEGSGIEIEVQDLPNSESDQYADELRKITRAIFQLDLNLRPFYNLLEARKRYSWVERRGGWPAPALANGLGRPG